MDELVSDVERLESALRDLFQALKQPTRWARIAAAAGSDIDRPAGAILQILHRHAPTESPFQVQDLARRLTIEAPSVTRKTQELERLGYLRRAQNSRDRRAVDLHLTPSGTEVAERLWQAQRSILLASLQQWSPKERQQFIHLFERFSRDISASSAPSHPDMHP